VRRAKGQFRAVLLLSALAFTGLDQTRALAADQPVAAADLGCGVVVMGAGDLYVAGFLGPRVCPWPQGPWLLLGNVFASAGRAAIGLVVGMNQDGQVLSASGDWLQIGIDYNGCNSVSASFQGNVFEIT